MKRGLLILGGILAAALIVVLVARQRNPWTGRMQPLSMTAEDEMELGEYLAPRMSERLGGLEPSVEAPRQRRRTIPYAPRLATSTEIVVLAIATNAVFRYHSTNLIRVNRNANCSRVHGSGQNIPRICWIWSSLLKAVISTK